jgi:hypothetical protein
MLGGTLSAAVQSRISAVDYRVNLDGLGVPAGDALFTHVLDGIRVTQ